MINRLFSFKRPLELRFQRFEFKYLVPCFLVNKIIADLLNYMDWDAYAAEQPGNVYQVSSLYLDTASFAAYRQKKTGVKKRQKLRVRTYETDLNPETIVFLEIKKKNDAVVLKDRIVSTYQDCSEFIEKGEFNGFSKRTCQEQETFKNFRWFKKRNCLLPKLMISYKRKPLVGKLDKKFRITFDQQIMAYPAQRLFFSQRALDVLPQKAVMELKYNGTVPDWFRRIIQKYQLNRETFSKYCRSLETIWRNNQYV